MHKFNNWAANCSAKIVSCYQVATVRLTDKKGDIAISTLAGILLSVFGLVLAMAALKQFMPGIFNTMFTNLKNKINDLWTTASTITP